MKRAELTPGMTVENDRGSAVIVVSTAGWRKSDSWNHKFSGHSVESFPVRVAGFITPGAAGVLCVLRSQIVVAREGGPEATPSLEGLIFQPNRLFPVGTLTAKRDAEDARYLAEHEATLAGDRALLGRVRDLWGPHADVLLEDAQVDADDEAPLTRRERDVVRVIILCGERRA